MTDILARTTAVGPLAIRISPDPLAEHVLVRTIEPVACGKETVPSGTIGTIVFIHEKDDAFEVELDPPFEAVVAFHRRQIEPA